MTNFQNALENCCLSGIEHQGDFSTCSNKHEDNSFMKERLDRALLNHAWASIFKKSYKECVAVRNYDHKLMLIHCSNMHQEYTKKERLFHYKACWNLKEECIKTIELTWRQLTGGRTHLERIIHWLNRCIANLTKWNNDRRINLTARSMYLTQKLKALQERENSTVLAEIKYLQFELNILRE